MNNVIKVAEKFEIKMAAGFGKDVLIPFHKIYGEHLHSAILHLDKATNILEKLKGVEDKTERTIPSIDQRINILEKISESLQYAKDDILYGIGPTLKAEETDE